MKESYFPFSSEVLFPSVLAFVALSAVGAVGALAELCYLPDTACSAAPSPHSAFTCVISRSLFLGKGLLPKQPF